MATREQQTANDIKVDPKALYLEEVFTDRRVGTIRRLTPVTKDGARDAARPVLYVGETQVLTPAGALPIGFEIGAASLEEAAEKFGQLATRSDRAHGEGAAGDAAPGRLADRRAAGPAAADGRPRRRQDPDALASPRVCRSGSSRARSRISGWMSPR